MNAITSPLAGLVFVCGASTVTAATSIGYVANASDSSVSVIDVDAHHVVGEPIAVGDHPSALILNPNGTRLYVANSWSGSVSVIDTTANRVVSTIGGISDPLAFAFSPNGAYLYVGATHGIDVVDTATNAIDGDPISVAPESVSGCPAFEGGMAIDASGELLYVATADCIHALETPGSVSVIDLSARKAIASVQVGLIPRGATYIASTQRLYVTNWYDDTVSVIDTAAGAILKGTIALPKNSYPLKSRANSSGTRLYVADEGHSISVIDTSTEAAAGQIPLSDEASDIAFVSEDSVYVTAETSNTVTMVSLDSGAIDSSPIPVGALPVALAVLPAGSIFHNGFEEL